MVLSVDEKSQIQALDRTQPGLPIKPGRCGTMTHDYKRNGTTTLFAALDVLDGKVIGRCMQRHRHQEFIRFLNAIEVEVPVGKIIHVILDNYGPHKHPKTRAWLSRHPRFVFHYTPTSASWLNAVEGFFAKLTKRRLKRGVFCSIVDLQAAINRFLRETNDDPKPFVWTADPEKMVAAAKQARDAAAREAAEKVAAAEQARDAATREAAEKVAAAEQARDAAMRVATEKVADAARKPATVTERESQHEGLALRSTKPSNNKVANAAPRSSRSMMPATNPMPSVQYQPAP